MPAWAMMLLAKFGVVALEYVQKNYLGPPTRITLGKYDTPCTVDCEARGIVNYSGEPPQDTPPDSTLLPDQSSPHN